MQQDVVRQLKTAGFTQTKTEAIEDLVGGAPEKDGEVERVSLNGDTSYKEGRTVSLMFICLGLVHVLAWRDEQRFDKFLVGNSRAVKAEGRESVPDQDDQADCD